MIVPDANLLIYAYSDGTPQHEAAREWWESLINGTERIGLPWAVATAFVRLMTHPRILAVPISPEHAIDHVRS